MAERNYRLAVGGAALLLFLLSLGVARRNDLWFDEVFTYDTASLPIQELIATTAKDVHPPLYYLIAKPFARGFNEPLLRLPSVIAGTLALLFFSTAVSSTSGKKYGGAFAILFALSPTIVRYSAEARQYAFVLLFWSIALWALSRLYKNFIHQARGLHPLNFVIYVLALLAGLYTHNLFYFPMIMTGLLALGVAVRAAKENAIPKIAGVLIGVHLVPVLAYLPWIAVVRSQIETMGGPLSWMPLPWLPQLQELYTLLPFSIFEHKRAAWHLYPAIILLKCGAFIFLWAALMARRWRRETRSILIILAVGSLLTTTIVYATSHYLVRIFFSQRYVSIVTPVVLLALVPLATTWPRKIWLWPLQGIMLAVILCTMVTYSARMLWVPLHTDLERVVELASTDFSQQSDEEKTTAPLYAVWVNFTEEECFEAYTKHRAPDVVALDIEDYWRDKIEPTPEAPVWIVVAQRPWQSGNPRAGIASYIVRGSELAAEPIVASTFQAFLISSTNWDAVRREIDILENPGAAQLGLNLLKK